MANDESKPGEVPAWKVITTKLALIKVQEDTRNRSKFKIFFKKNGEIGFSKFKLPLLDINETADFLQEYGWFDEPENSDKSEKTALIAWGLGLSS